VHDRFDVAGLLRPQVRLHPPEDLVENQLTQFRTLEHLVELALRRVGDQPGKRFRAHPGEVDPGAGQPLQPGDQPDELVTPQVARVDQARDRVDVHTRDAVVGRVELFEQNHEFTRAEPADGLDAEVGHEYLLIPTRE
jgi:hypothetical protein